MRGYQSDCGDCARSVRKLTPELAADIVDRGIVLTGGERAIEWTPSLSRRPA
ncbi:MAG: hypothetical protein ACLRZ5_13360 [Ruminococcus sp.]